MGKKYKTGHKITETAAKQAVNQMEFETANELGVINREDSKEEKKKNKK